MSEYAKRLRAITNSNYLKPHDKVQIHQAADEIERLTAELQHARMVAAEREEGLIRYEKANAKLQAVVDAARKEHCEIKGLLGIERDSIADIVSETNIRCLEVRVDATDKALAALETGAEQTKHQPDCGGTDCDERCEETDDE